MVLEALWKGEVGWWESGKGGEGGGSWGNGALGRVGVLAIWERLREGGEREIVGEREREWWGGKYTFREVCLVGGVGCTHIHPDALLSCLCWWFVLGRIMEEGEKRGKGKGAKENQCGSLVASAVEEWLKIREELEKEREIGSESKKEPERGKGGEWEELMEGIDFSVSEELRKKLSLTLSLGECEGGDGEREAEKGEREEVIREKELSLLVRENMYGKYFAIHSIDALCLCLLFLMRCGEEPERCLCEVIFLFTFSSQISPYSHSIPFILSLFPSDCFNGGRLRYNCLFSW